MEDVICEKGLRAMRLHEKVTFNMDSFFMEVLRVYRGWIYNQYDKGNSLMSSVFVPE